MHLVKIDVTYIGPDRQAYANGSTWTLTLIVEEIEIDNEVIDVRVERLEIKNRMAVRVGESWMNLHSWLHLYRLDRVTVEPYAC